MFCRGTKIIRRRLPEDPWCILIILTCLRNSRGSFKNSCILRINQMAKCSQNREQLATIVRPILFLALYFLLTR